MSRYRKINCKIHKDQKFPYLSINARLLFLYHLTSELSTPFLLYVEGEGSMFDNARLYNPGDPAPSLDAIRAAKAELTKADMVRYATDGSNLVFLPNALLHPENHPDGGKSGVTWINLFNDLPRTPFFEECLGHWRSILPRVIHAAEQAARGKRNANTGAADFIKLVTTPPAKVPGAPRETSRRAGKKTPPPESLDITDEMRTWAHGPESCADDEIIRIETASMLDHFRGKGETKVDWVATWRNWMRKAKEIRESYRAGRGRNRGPSKPRDVHRSVDGFHQSADHVCQHGLFSCYGPTCAWTTVDVECRNRCPYMDPTYMGSTEAQLDEMAEEVRRREATANVGKS